MRSRGFTLVELLIVGVLLAAFAAIVTPTLTGSDEDARIAAVATTVQRLQKRIDMERARTGRYPTSGNSAWFLGYKRASNALYSDPAIAVRLRMSLTANDGQKHPAVIVRDNSAFWYNPSNGTVRALVPSTYKDPISVYNAVNDVSLDTL